MKVAISVDENKGLDSLVSFHFGRCPYFAFVEVEGTQVGNVEVVDNPYYENHQPGMVPAFINSHGANVMLSGGMGRRAIALFEEYGIQAMMGASGTVMQALQSHLGGELESAEPCREGTFGKHDDHHDGCGH